MNREPEPEDVAAVIGEGDLVPYLLSLTGRARRRANEPAAEDAPTAIPASPLHRPGAWPAGTRPPGPNTCSPDCDCALTSPSLEEL